MSLVTYSLYLATASLGSHHSYCIKGPWFESSISYFHFQATGNKNNNNKKKTKKHSFSRIKSYNIDLKSSPYEGISFWALWEDILREQQVTFTL